MAAKITITKLYTVSRPYSLNRLDKTLLASFNLPISASLKHFLECEHISPCDWLPRQHFYSAVTGRWFSCMLTHSLCFIILSMYIIHFDHFHPQLTFSFSSISHWNPSSQQILHLLPCLFIAYVTYGLRLVGLAWVRLLTGRWVTCQWLYHWKAWGSLLLTPVVPQGGMEIYDGGMRLIYDCIAQSCVSLGQKLTISKHS